MNDDLPRIGLGSASPDDNDPTVALLRGALQREADRIAPSAHGLQRIQRQLNTGQPARRGSVLSRFTPALTAAAAVAVLAVAGAAAVRLGHPSATGSPAGPATAPTATASASTATPTATATKLPVYVIGRQGDRSWLFREYRASFAMNADDRVAEAITDATTLPPLDPDYDAPLFQGGQGSRAKAVVTPSLITVTLTAAMVSNTGISRADAELAVQQLVFTATAAAGDGYGHVPVQFTVANGNQVLFGVLPLDQPFTRWTGAQDPRAPVWITSLAQKTDFGKGANSVEGDSRSGGGQVTWVLVKDGVPVGHGKVTPGGTSAGRTLWTIKWQARTHGNYTLTVSLQPAPDSGLSPSATWQDTRDFVVR